MNEIKLAERDKFGYINTNDCLAERKQCQAALDKKKKRAEKAEAENKKLKSLLERIMRHLTNKGAFRVEPYSTEYEKLRDAP